MFDGTEQHSDAASALFNLPGYRVEHVDPAEAAGPGSPRRVFVVADDHTEVAPSCPDCGHPAARQHSRRWQRVRDVPVAGPIQVFAHRVRWACTVPSCPRVTFTAVTGQLPLRARSTTRLKDAVVDAVCEARRVLSEVATAMGGLSWATVQGFLDESAAAMLFPENIDRIPVRVLGIDEHRYRRVRFFRTADGAWQRHEPWMSTLVDLDTGRVLGVVDGRGSAGIGAWLATRTADWRDRIEVVAIDPSAAFRKAIAEHLPSAAVAVDPFHLVALANETVSAVRRRVTADLNNGKRGGKRTPAWTHRMLLLRAGDTLTPAGRARLQTIFTDHDPTGELAAAWGIKEQVRTLIASSSLTDLDTAHQYLHEYVTLADMPETDTLLATVQRWRDEIEVTALTGVTNARTEAANTMIKNIKRSGRGFRNPTNYRTRILLVSAARTRPARTFICG